MEDTNKIDFSSRELRLHDSGITDEGIMEISQRVGASTTTKLNLSHNCITAHGASKLLNFLLAKKIYIHIDLSDNNIAETVELTQLIQKYTYNDKASLTLHGNPMTNTPLREYKVNN